MIQQKDKIFYAIQQEQKKRYNKLLSQLKNDSTIKAFEIKAIIEVYDEQSEKLLLTLHNPFTEQFYTIKIFGVELDVCFTTYSIVEKLGAEALTQDLIVWADVNVKHQRWFKVKSALEDLQL